MAAPDRRSPKTASRPARRADIAPSSNGSPPAPECAVTGRVFESASKEGLPGLMVAFFAAGTASGNGRIGAPARREAALTGAQRLGCVATGPTGEYSFAYSRSDLIGAAARGFTLVVTVSAPEDEKTGAEGKVLYVSSPRPGAARLETLNVGITRDTLDKAGLGEAAAAVEGVDAYARGRIREQALAAGVVEFHKEEILKDKAAKEDLRSKLFDAIATNPDVAVFAGELVRDGDSIADKQDTVAQRAVARANTDINDGRGVPVNLYLSPEDRDRLAPFFQSAVDGIATIPERVLGPILFRSREQDNPGTLLINQNPIARFCAEQSFEEACAREHTGLPGAEHDGQPPSDGDGPVTGPGIEVLTGEDVPRLMARVLDKAPSPDAVLTPEFNNRRADGAAVQDSVDAFELRKGPADVPAFYDFQSLQIAFEHVWRILMDEDLVEAGHILNKRYEARTGLPLLANFPRNWTDLLSGTYVYGSIPQEVPADVAAQFDITLEEWTDLTAAHQAKLADIAKKLGADCEGKTTVSILGTTITLPASRYGSLACERKRQDLREQGERLIDLVRHDDYYTLHKTLRDLHDRINSAYEFTVFAADKDTHAVNFGLMNTYRQQWEPVKYQAGKLVKTIPLSPKEERKYTFKTSRSVKTARKEAEKNNSSLTREQSSTARVEADIVQKAQNKTNFGMSADGSYNIGISKGKNTTTFGVEAQQESSSSRKDFREAVLKAVQDYKDERVVSVDTEAAETSEYSETGTIVNPNDELSVTYLFYELQRRYKVSERLHRVMPVVLVAQEVPAPNQITEAWVIANDWILNRFLLDDSFRPALTYLANKSVGDDFALRELRKNLRQQRNLVETLRIELSIASNEAENRYRALESAIEKRIDEEHAEKTDGWFSDVGEFFGGGGQDPEAAKARELAAKDAHQYAVEKAEKAASALQQEVANLHKCTAEYNDTLRGHLDNETRVKRLLVHIRNNIFHYMQAIWSMEPPDQRFLRLHKVQVPVLELETVANPEDGSEAPDRTYRVQVEPVDDIFASFRAPGTTKHKASMSGRLKPITRSRPLVEVADLDSPLGYKGNYQIFPLKEHNALTEFMAAPYVDSAFGAMDPDDLSNVTLDEYGKYVCCLHDRLPPGDFENLKPLLKRWLEVLLADPLRNGEEITLPTDSLFIEILPGAHPLLEDFKLRHRELDVYKAAEDIRKARMETLRLASRLLNDEREDPDVEKKIVVANGVHALIGAGDA
jgi:hypothetical protein